MSHASTKTTPATTWQQRVADTDWAAVRADLAVTAAA
jgi:hypothetical protein